MKGKAMILGTFDGVHLGHQKLLKALIKEARARKLTPMAALFSYSPGLFFRGQDAVVKLISTVEERKELMSRLFGIQEFQVLPMNAKFFSLSAEDFLSKVVRKRWGVKLLVAGRNFGLGKDRALNESSAKRMGAKTGVEVQLLSLVRRSAPISSTRIRGALAEGDLNLASKLLGRPYEINGTVVRGAGIGGAKLGFPTANLKVDPVKILPMGVFSAWVPQLERWAAVNIGRRPTVRKKGSVQTVVEAHILNFRGELYGKPLTLELRERLRGEKRFESLEDLRKQIQKDVERVAKRARS